MNEQKQLSFLEATAAPPRKNPAEVRLNLLTADSQSPDLSPRARALLGIAGRIAETEIAIDRHQREIADQGVTLGFAFGELLAQPTASAARFVCQAVAAIVSGDEIKRHLLRKVELAETWRSFREAKNQALIVPYVKGNERQLAVKGQILTIAVNRMREQNLIRIGPDGSIVTLASSDQQEREIAGVIDDLGITQRLLQMHQDRPTALTIATRRAKKFVEAARNDAKRWDIAEADIRQAVERGQTRSKDFTEV